MNKGVLQASGPANRVMVQDKKGAQSLSKRALSSLKKGKEIKAQQQQKMKAIVKSKRTSKNAKNKRTNTSSSYSIPYGAVIALAGVVLIGLFVATSTFKDQRVDKSAPLDRQGLPAPKDPAPLADEHEALRKEIMGKKLTKEEWEERKRGRVAHRFNQFVSDRLPLDRQYHDMRQEECFDQRYYPNSELPTTSVILIFHNEAMSTLLRTATSVLRMSPPELLTEVLLVDDHSTGDWLGDALDEAVAQLPKTRLIRLPERHGLIKAKIAGAKAAKGDTITFLDSHCECNAGWLEPLLDRIRRNKLTVAVPTIDTIEYKDFSIVGMGSTRTRGIFTWQMQFSWKEMTQAEKESYSSIVDPFKTPAMAGGLFTMDRNAFFELGAYDEGQHTWGGENLEMSFRIWMCGGQIESVPCSRVSHVFRETNPVKFKDNDPTKTINRNLRRVSDVWMDDYAQYVYDLKNLGGDEYKSNVTERKLFRERMNCKSFQWYLENVYPDMFVPSEDNVLGKKALYNKGSQQCVDTLTTVYDDIQRVGMSGCVVENGEQLIEEQTIFFAKDTNTLRHIGEFGDKCIRAFGKTVAFIECDEQDDLVWTFDKVTGLLRHNKTGNCLLAKESGDETFEVALDACDDSDSLQTWDFLVEENFDI